jgi:ATP-dependent Clp protease ATP-binding subunit ClpC
MFERFTDRGRTVVVLAEEEARGLDHNYIGTEHLLLGLLAEGNGRAAQVLHAAGITIERVREEVARIVGEGAALSPSADLPPASLPFTVRSKKVLEQSLRESLNLGQEHIATEHILLGLVDEREGVGAQILAAEGFTPDRARAAVLTRLAAQGGIEPRVSSWRGAPGFRQRFPRGQNTTPAVAELYLRARQRAGDSAVSSAEMLRALLQGDSRAARALASLGVTGDAVDRALAETPVEGTSDETAQDAVARMVQLSKQQDRIVVEILDPQLAGRLTTEMAELRAPLARALDHLRQELWNQARKAETESATMEE